MNGLLKKKWLKSNLWNRIIAKLRQRLSIYQLMSVREPDISIVSIGCFDTSNFTADKAFEIVIFGKTIDCNTIDWHCDYNSGYSYPPKKRFDKIKFNKLYNQGIDVIFPWELSRFQFGIDLALCYRQNKDKKYYSLFKGLVLDWMAKNPFLYGVNWICPMDVAIRAANWIVAVNLFDDICREDRAFVSTISKSLYYHACYIEKFPEKFSNGENNHLVADYSGLFVLALSFRDSNIGKRWLGLAKDGLASCMEKQVYDDGVDFENSIPYHRLVLELFAVPVILARHCNLEFPAFYYGKLFKMFEFVGAYIDSKGNAPQIGDNDSGRFMKLSPCEEHNHRYLLALGRQIFDHDFFDHDFDDYDFDDYDFDADNSQSCLLPVFKPNANRINLAEIGIIPRNVQESVFFTTGGFYFLKNERFTVSVFCPDSRGGGHRHFDSGSFTLSCQGEPVVVDPGSGVYTADLQIRNCLRDYPSHNLYYIDKPNDNNRAYFGINVDLDVKIVYFSESEITMKASFENDVVVERHFLLQPRSFHIRDRITGNHRELLSAIHFAEKELHKLSDNTFLFRNLVVALNGAKAISILNYLYSPSYSLLDEREKIVLQPGHTVTIDFISK